MTRLSRTFQTAPAAVPKENSAKYLDSGLQAEGFQAPDWLVPDLEDGTAPNQKEEALANTVDRLAGGTDFGGEIWPRVQWGYDSERDRDRGREEIETLVREVGDEIDGVVVPKVGRVEDVERAATAVAEAEREYGRPDGSIEFSVIVETARAKSDLREISKLGAGSRLAGLVFGPVDYTAELGARAIDGSRPTWDGLLADLSNEASANGLVSVGGPFDDLFRERAGVRFYNGDAYANQVEREAKLGLDGSWSLYPKQTAQANRIHMPTEAELRRDVSKIERFEAAKSEGTGAVTLDGQMVDEATFKNFANTVRTVHEIDEVHPAQTAEAYDEDLLERALDLDPAW
ncbi:citrate lyase subunit beta [Halostella sp. JP-L12]|uniref:L-malyl-CoA/beta-methylmalyl-CoA lyase n=1 Tax=Halostella TaxID=1843185 RepID=UPI000EF7B76C|nr:MULTISPECIES: L-malyl-CoA/beta-methylmalyl-CoA lyase [Halostella]NHN48925.1 citrate lyase subunit beta [Halostella sp. JP-L12]